MRLKKFLLFAPLALVGLTAFVTLGGVIVQYLWNWLMPAIFGWHTLTLWQALGLLLLCRILFGGFGGHRGMHGGGRGRMRARWNRMTPEERDRFKQAMRARCGVGPMVDDPAPQ